MSEETALPTKPQPLPYEFYFYLSDCVFTPLPDLKLVIDWRFTVIAASGSGISVGIAKKCKQAEN